MSFKIMSTYSMCMCVYCVCAHMHGCTHVWRYEYNFTMKGPGMKIVSLDLTAGACRHRNTDTYNRETCLGFQT